MPCVVRLNEMVAFDANEALTPCREGRGIGAILFDRERLRQADIGLFSPKHWGSARPVGEGGRGSAWFVDAPFGASVLRHYLRAAWRPGSASTSTSGAARTGPAASPNSA